MAWPDSAARVNDAKLATFGGPVTYYAVQGTADPVVINAIRGTRDPLEGDQFAAMERIWTLRSKFAAPPQKGDVVTLGSDSTEYVVFDIQADTDTNSDGLRLYLNKRRRPFDA